MKMSGHWLIQNLTGVFLSKRIGVVQGGMSNGLRKLVPGGTIEIHSAHEVSQIKLIA